PPTPLNVTVSAGMCLPRDCGSADLSSLINGLCHLPTCAGAWNADSPHLISACAAMQMALCGPRNRLAFQHHLTLECADPPPDNRTTSHHTSPWDTIFNVLDSRFLYPSRRAVDTTIDVDILDDILSCGPSYLRNLRST